MNKKLLRILPKLKFFALTEAQAVLHCSKSCSQSFKSTEFWNYFIQNVALNGWVETKAVQLL
jgi:hypothetical protein